MPLGLVERGLAVTEVATVVLMGAWAWQAAARRPVPDTSVSVAATIG